jgi:hypothetical protein
VRWRLWLRSFGISVESHRNCRLRCAWAAVGMRISSSRASASASVTSDGEFGASARAFAAWNSCASYGGRDRRQLKYSSSTYSCFEFGKVRTPGLRPQSSLRSSRYQPRPSGQSRTGGVAICCATVQPFWRRALRVRTAAQRCGESRGGNLVANPGTRRDRRGLEREIFQQLADPQDSSPGFESLSLRQIKPFFDLHENHPDPSYENRTKSFPRHLLRPSVAQEDQAREAH